MARQRSSIDMLPEDIRQKLQELLRDPRVTQLQATAEINAILSVTPPGAPPDKGAGGLGGTGGISKVTKSSVNRYAVKMDKVGAKLRESREVAEAWIGKLGAAPQGQVGNLVNEILRTLTFDVSIMLQNGNMNKKTAPGAVKMINNMALTMQRLEKAANLNVAREKEIKQQALEEAAKTATATARQAGVSEETIQTIWRDVLRMTS